MRSPNVGDWRRDWCSLYFPLAGGESDFSILASGLAPSQVLEIAREGLALSNLNIASS
jgi:hypothetical protein